MLCSYDYACSAKLLNYLSPSVPDSALFLFIGAWDYKEQSSSYIESCLFLDSRMLDHTISSLSLMPYCSTLSLLSLTGQHSN